MAIELYKHNKKAYSNVLEHFETTNRTCVVHATGTGKSFISLKWLEDNKDKKCLFLAPTHAIIDQFKTHIEDNGLSLSDFPNLEFELYTNVNNRIADNKYDCIVMDEFHRCGAKEWSKGINKLLDNNEDAKVLGLSATPIRYLDDNRNMADEIFDGDIASEISLAEAIAMGILPPPTYIASIYSFDDEIEKIQGKINKYKNKEEREELQKRLNEAKQEIEKSRGLSEVFEKYITNTKGKYIVFCKDKPHMELIKEKSNEWFKNINKIKVNDVYYEKGRELNKYAIDSFENNERDELKLLFSIEMLNEGVHVKSIDGVIMFRPTSSPIIYFQQLGRALSVGHNAHPIVFDVVNNYECLDQIHKLKGEVARIIGTGSSTGIGDILDNFKIIDCNKDIREILDKLDDDLEITFDERLKEVADYLKSEEGQNIRFYSTINKNFSSGYDMTNWLYKNKQKIIEVSNENEDAKYIVSRFNWIFSFEQGIKEVVNYLKSEEGKNIMSVNAVNKKFSSGSDMSNWLIYNKTKIIEASNDGNEDALYIVSRFNWTFSFDQRLKEVVDYLKSEEGQNITFYRTINKKFSSGYSMRFWLDSNKPKIIEISNENEDALYIVNRFSWIFLFDQHLKEVTDYLKSKEGQNITGYSKIKKKFSSGSDMANWISLNKPKIIEVSNENEDALYIAKRFEWLKEKVVLSFEQRLKEVADYLKSEEGQNIIFYNNINKKFSSGTDMAYWIYGNKPKIIEVSNENEDALYIAKRFEWFEEKLDWGGMYELAKAYSESHNGSLKISQNFKTVNGYEYDEDGIALGSWISTQRGVYKGQVSGILTQEQIKMLEDIGMIWFTDKIDDKLQSQIIDEKNKLKKQKEILNRFNSLLNNYDGESLPSKEDMNDDFIDQLNRMTR